MHLTALDLVIRGEIHRAGTVEEKAVEAKKKTGSVKLEILPVVLSVPEFRPKMTNSNTKRHITEK